VVKDDGLLYEHYFNGYDHGSTQTSFSVAKSFASALVGIAVDDGTIALDDPITDYLPKLKERDARFDKITIRHLISMSSGLRYEEQGTPWSDDTETYYAPDLRQLALSDSEIVGPPGELWHYNNFNPLLMGMILERATSQHVAEFMEARLWQPLGAEADASWSLDSVASGFEKMESGINARAIDFRHSAMRPSPGLGGLSVQRLAATIHARESNQTPSSLARAESISRSRSSTRAAES